MTTGHPPKDRGRRPWGCGVVSGRKGGVGRAVGPAVLMSIGLFGVACSSGGHRTGAPKASSPTAPMSASTSMAPSTAPTLKPPEANAAAAVEDAYRKAMALIVDYGSKTGPFDPVAFRTAFSVYFVGSEYDFLFNAMQQQRLRGDVYRPATIQPGELSPTVTMGRSRAASIRDCPLEHPRFNASTNQRVDTPGRRTVFVADMVLEPDGNWKMEHLTDTDQECAS